MRKNFALKVRANRGKFWEKKEKDLKRITSEAYRTAQEVKGKADAEATTIYAQAFGVDPQFYSFVKTLEIYGSADKGKLAGSFNRYGFPEISERL